MNMKEKLMRLKSVATPVKKDEASGLKAALIKLLGDNDSKLKDRLGSMQKVSVMAKDKDGLKEGLEKAQELMSSKELPDMEDSEEMEDESPEHEMAESSEEESSEDLETPESIDMKIQELMEKRKKLQLLKV